MRSAVSLMATFTYRSGLSCDGEVEIQQAPNWAVYLSSMERLTRLKTIPSIFEMHNLASKFRARAKMGLLGRDEAS